MDTSAMTKWILPCLSHFVFWYFLRHSFLYASVDIVATLHPLALPKECVPGASCPLPFTRDEQGPLTNGRFWASLLTPGGFSSR